MVVEFCYSVYTHIQAQFPWIFFTLIRSLLSISLVMLTALAFNPGRKPHTRSGNELWTHVVNKRWFAALQRVYTDPEETRYRNSLNDTVLHLACTNNPPVPVIAALLKMFPEACSIQNDSGCTPLHLAVRGSSEKIVQKILEANLNAISVRNNRGDTPLSLLCWPRLERSIIKQALDEPLPLSSDFDPNTILDNNEMLARIWNSACILVKAACHKSAAEILPGNKKWRMVHACCSIPDCPLDLLRLAIKLHPEQLEQVDEEGRLPLHLAIVSARLKQWEWEYDGLIETMIEAYPGAITRTDMQSGLYPFLIAAVGECASLTWVYRLLRESPELERIIGRQE